MGISSTKIWHFYGVLYSQKQTNKFLQTCEIKCTINELFAVQKVHVIIIVFVLEEQREN